jgi:hypothetical protein
LEYFDLADAGGGTCDENCTLAEKDHAEKIWVLGRIDPRLVCCGIFDWNGAWPDHLDAAIVIRKPSITKAKSAGIPALF